jgi:hypothetical protein
VLSGCQTGSLLLPAPRSFYFSQIQVDVVMVSEHGSCPSGLSGPFSDSSLTLNVFKSVLGNLIPSAAFAGK